MSSTESDDSGSSGSEMESVWEGDGVAYSIFDDFQSPYAVEVYRHMASKFGFCHSILGKGTLHRIALVTYLEREKARGSDPLESYRRVCADPSIVLDHLDEYINPPFSNEKLIWDFLESSDEEDDEGVFQRHLHLERGTKTAKSQTKKCIQDDDYFKGYKNLAIHREMVNDRVRTGAYESFIRLNKSLFKDKVVLDVGSGCGILSLFAAKAGARLVVGIDNCDNMIKMSENHARINGITNVQFLHGKVEDSDLVYSGGVVQFKRDDLPCEPFKCDILISEWMGYALLYENMLSSVLFARDRYLISGGLMVPSKVKLGLFAVDMYDDIKSKLNEWDERKYGLILDGLRYEAHELLKEPVVEVVDPSRIVSDASGICILDLGRLNKQDLGKAHEFQVDVHDGCKCSSLALYFDCIFEPVASADAIQSLKGKCFQTLESYREVLGIDELTSYVTSPDYIHPEEPKSTVVVMSTRADQPPTHWKQVILHLTDHNNRPVAIQGTIGGKLSLLNNSSNCRWLDILFQPDDTSLLGECYYKLM